MKNKNKDINNTDTNKKSDYNSLTNSKNIISSSNNTNTNTSSNNTNTLAHSNNNSNNHSNNTNTNNNCVTNNINNITIEIKNPIPFDEDWCTSHINKYHLEHFLFSKQMYTDLLKEILENEINLNVIIDKKKNDDVGWIYKNDNDKYIMMNIKDIVDNSMDKLHKKLKEINLETTQKSEIDINHLIPSKYTIKEKYEKYKNNSKNIKNDVDNIVSKIFETKNIEAFDIYNEISKNLEQNPILEY